MQWRLLLQKRYSRRFLATPSCTTYPAVRGAATRCAEVNRPSRRPQPPATSRRRPSRRPPSCRPPSRRRPSRRRPSRRRLSRRRPSRRRPSRRRLEPPATQPSATAAAGDPAAGDPAAGHPCRRPSHRRPSRRPPSRRTRRPWSTWSSAASVSCRASCIGREPDRREGRPSDVAARLHPERSTVNNPLVYGSFRAVTTGRDLLVAVGRHDGGLLHLPPRTRPGGHGGGATRRPGGALEGVQLCSATIAGRRSGSRRASTHCASCTWTMATPMRCN